MLYSLGNVGIGGIDPLYKFTVAGSTTMNGLLNVNAAISADNLYIVGKAGIAGSNDCSCKLCSKPPHTKRTKYSRNAHRWCVVTRWSGSA